MLNSESMVWFSCPNEVISIYPGLASQFLYSVSSNLNTKHDWAYIERLVHLVTKGRRILTSFGSRLLDLAPKYP